MPGGGASVKSFSASSLPQCTLAQARAQRAPSIQMERLTTSIHCRMPPPPRARISVGACAHHHSRCTPLRPRVHRSLPLDATTCAWLRAPGLASVCRGARSLPCSRSPATSATRCCFTLLPCCWDSCAATAQAGRCYFCYCSAVATAEARHRLLMLLRCRCCFAVLLPLLVTAAATGRTHRCSSAHGLLCMLVGMCFVHGCPGMRAHEHPMLTDMRCALLCVLEPANALD